LDDTHINLMGVHDDESIFLTQEEQELFLLSQTEVNEEAEETEQQAFENAIMEVHRQYNLRNKKMNDNPPKKATETKKIVETKKTSEILPRKSLRGIMLNLLQKETLQFYKDQIRLRFHQLVNQVLLPRRLW
jgi:hypothetical protein